MEEIVIIKEEYAERAERVMEAHHDLAWIKGMEVRIAFLASDRIKKSHGRPVLGECVKVGGIYKALLPYDFLIVIYEVNTAGLTDSQLDILFYHELLHIGINKKGDGFTVRPHDIQEFQAVAEQYGAWWTEKDMEVDTDAEEDEEGEAAEDEEGTEIE